MKKINKTVSVIVPAYNSEKYISRCIKSILGQNYELIELIIVDDGSIDNTKEIVESFQDKRIRYIYQKNSGVSSARNKGISVSTGGYVMFADADDEFEKNAVEKAVEFMEQNDVDIVRYSYKEKYANNEKVINIGDIAEKKIAFGSNNAQIAIDAFLGEKAYMKCLVMTLMIKKDFLEKNNIRFRQNLYMMEDVVFYTDLFRANARFYFLNESLYIYYQNADSVTHDSKKLERTIRGVLMANKEIVKRFQKEQTTINNRHFRIVMSLITQNYETNKKIPHIDKLKNLALRTEFKRGVASKALRYSIINDRKMLFTAIIKVKAYKNRLRNKERTL